VAKKLVELITNQRKKKYTKANSSRGCLTRMDVKYEEIRLPHDELYQTWLCHNICKENIPWVLIPPNARVMRFKPCMFLNDMLHILKEAHGVNDAEPQSLLPNI
jgi:hypothetical protein